MILTNVLNAVGLEASDRNELEALLDVLSTVESRNRVLREYYESDVAAKYIGIETVPESVNVEECCSWPKKAVTSVSERSRFDGFVFASGGADMALSRAVLDNALVGSYSRHVSSELLHGCMFATVGRIGSDAAVRFHTAETAAATWDEAAGRIGSGLVLADRRRTPWSPKQAVPVQVNMHLPGRVVVLRREDVARWVAEPMETPLDRPMMEAFAFRATGIKPFGESRISKPVMTITDDVIRTLANMAVSGAFYAAPQKYLLGLTDEMYDKLSKDKWSTFVGELLMSTRGENGEVPTFGQLSAASPQPYIDMLRTYAQLFSAATGVPVNSLGIVQDNPSSAQAIESSREDICLAAEDLNESSKESLRNVALMAMAVAENKRIDELTDDQKSVMACFKNPSMPSVVSQADAATKIAAVDQGFAGTSVFYRMLGFDEATITQVNNEKAKNRASAAVAALLAPKEATGADTPRAAGRPDEGA